jgi:hypothetical protein
MKGIADWKMKECKSLLTPTAYTRVDEEFEMELEGPGITVDVLASFDVIFADIVVLGPVPKLNDSGGVGVVIEVGVASEVGGVSEVGIASEVGEVGESELCSAAVFKAVLISVFVAQHAGVPSG